MDRQLGYPNRRAPVRSRLSSVEQVRPATPLPVTVVIPTRNEAENIGHVLELMPDVAELVVVDAYSDDGTIDVVLQHRPDAVIVLQKPAGRGNAVRAGLEVATADYIVSMDGDGRMDPGEIPGYVALLAQGFDVVKGSRGALGGRSSTELTPLRRAGNRGVAGLYNLMFRTRLSDITFGYIALRRECLARLGLYADDRCIEVQILTHAQLAGLRLAELPSKEAEPIGGESHLSSFKDNREVLSTIVRARLSPGREWWRHVGSPAPSYEVLGQGRPAEDRIDVTEQPVREMPAGRNGQAVRAPVIPRQRRMPGASSTA
ncbi:MAG: glycosyltransferase family 2 protein [Marmoricola sp.]